MLRAHLMPRQPQPKLSFTATTGRTCLPYLRRHLPRAIALVPSCLQELSIALVGEQRMARLHEDFMQIPGPTDVLTFELEHDRRGNVTSGEIVICVPVAQRHARRAGHAVCDEVLLYALHGVLHLTGFDDLTEDGYCKMHRKEDEILKRLGIGAVFASGQPPQPRSRLSRRGGGQ